MNAPAAVRAEVVEVSESGRGKYTVDITAGPNHLVADEPKEAGGNDMGPRPHELFWRVSARARR